MEQTRSTWCSHSQRTGWLSEPQRGPEGGLSTVRFKRCSWLLNTVIVHILLFNTGLDKDVAAKMAFSCRLQKLNHGSWLQSLHTQRSDVG